MAVEIIPAATLAIIASLLAVVFRGIYLAYIHPLAKIPGPKLYAITDIPFMVYTARGKWHYRLKELHDQYGQVVRFAPYDVSFTKADAWQDIYGHKNSGAETFEKDPHMYVDTRSGHPSIINANRADHKRMRRLMSHAFSEKALRNQEDILKKYVDMLINKLTDLATSGEILDLVKWYNFTSFDLIGDLAFGEPFGCLENRDYHPWVSMVFDSVRYGLYDQVFSRHPVMKLLAPLIVPAKVVQSMREHDKLSMATAMRRIDTGNTEREDFMSYILRHNDEKGMSVGEIAENANTLIVAGSETTATHLSGTTFQLLKNPEAYKILVEEIRASFASEDEITLTSVNELKYLPAVIDEGFRMYPPVPVGLSRITPKGGASIAGTWIHENTRVSLPQWSAYQSEAHWVEPGRFLPERWLGDPRFAGDTREVLNPFSRGPRNCIGRNLAYAELRLILTRVLWNFDLELMPNNDSWNHQHVFLLWEKGPLRVKLTPLRQGDKDS
ncbi:putative Isotrichodermin C-15 hydroxylase [Seiridium cardinale]|uniref:Isotrichodermin C-15 hydroxylase n=1 Tax=Seiridium cardinale TaxID=138064 RepID=A0ABR2XTK8_9PEZI